ncbi:CaiB/BaiF CoA transferase family protein [Chloroflexota bacterium]
MLSGVKVLDLTHYISGPYCTQLLVQLGAEVLKVEKPVVGDGSRQLGPFYRDNAGIETSALYLLLNTGKRSITLNLKSETGKEFLLKLVKWADIIVENFAPGEMEKLGLGYEILSQVNPKLIMTSISNFGQSGPYRDYKANELILLALSGVMYMTGPYEKPVKYGLYQMQYMAGSEAATAIIAMYYAREINGGNGDYIDVPIVESMKHYVNNHGSYYSYMGAIRGRLAKVPDMIDMILPVKDGYVAPVFFGYVDWSEFCTMLESPELDISKFSDAKSRRVNRKELTDLLVKKFSKFNKFDLVSMAQDWRFPFGMVQTAKDIMTCPQLDDREYYVELDHPVVGHLKYPGVPFKMTESPMEIAGRAPLLGEHNEHYYSWLGCSPAEIEHMESEGVI